MSEATPNMYKKGDWVHTQDGIGLITLVFPHYYQYWQKAMDDKYRSETYGDDEKLATSLLGEKKEVGDWIKDIIYIKRLCDHDAKPKKRIMCFQSLAYANDKITAKEKKAVDKALKDKKLADRFHSHKCLPNKPSRAWNILIPASKAVHIQNELHKLNGNREENLNMTMKEVEDYFNASFDVDIYAGLHNKLFANAIIQTQLHPEDDPGYYNKDREEVVCSIRIARKHYDGEYLQNLCKAQSLDPELYDSGIWAEAGWNDAD